MTAAIDFIKMHGLGNDYIYVNCMDFDFPRPEQAAVVLSDRHFGIGADGLVLIQRSTAADLRMRMFNADGSEAEMCGNAIRCVASLAYEQGLCTKEQMTIASGSGIKRLELKVSVGRVTAVRVAMGFPELRTQQIPVKHSAPQALRLPLTIAGHELEFTAVSMGNPHAVFFVTEISDELVLGLGPQIERHALFPQRVNAEFVQVLSPNELKMRVWERGSGETLACGTGACAAVVAAVLNELTERKVQVNLPGGSLEIEWPAGGEVYMSGPAEFVFSGTVSVSW